MAAVAAAPIWNLLVFLNTVVAVLRNILVSTAEIYFRKVVVVVVDQYVLRLFA